MKQRLNINTDCSNMAYLPNIKIVLPYRKNYYSKPKIDHDVGKEKYDELSKNSFGKENFEEFQIELTPEDYIIDGRKIAKVKKNAIKIANTKADNNSNDLDINLGEVRSLLEQDMECHPAFMAIDVPPPRGPLFVFGEYFLRKFYTVFDRDRLLIGFAESKEIEEKEDDKILTPYDNNEAEQNDSKEDNNIQIKKEENLENKLNDGDGELELDDLFLTDKNKQKPNETSKQESDKKETSTITTFTPSIMNEPQNNQNKVSIGITPNTKESSSKNNKNNNSLEDINLFLDENGNNIETTKFDDFIKMTSFLDKELSLDLI